jgi:alanyl-tRNA synthetase
VVLATSSNDKVTLVATVTTDLIQKVHAGKLVKEIAAVVGGSGGGRAEMAEAGGKDPSRIVEALQGVAPFVSDALS